jgi:hypothetical protein
MLHTLMILYITFFSPVDVLVIDNNQFYFEEINTLQTMVDKGNTSKKLAQTLVNKGLRVNYQENLTAVDLYKLIKNTVKFSDSEQTISLSTHGTYNDQGHLIVQGALGKLLDFNLSVKELEAYNKQVTFLLAVCRTSNSKVYKPVKSDNIKVIYATELGNTSNLNIDSEDCENYFLSAFTQVIIDNLKFRTLEDLVTNINKYMPTFQKATLH